MDKGTQGNAGYVILALPGVRVLPGYLQQWQQVEPLPSSEFLAAPERRNARQIAVYPDLIEGTLTQPRPGARTRFSITRVALARAVAGHAAKA